MFATLVAIAWIMLDLAVPVVVTSCPNAIVSMQVVPMQKMPLSSIKRLSRSQVDAAAKPPDRYSDPDAFVR